MIEINLLPKEYFRKPLSLSLGRSGVYVAVGAVGVVAMLFGITLYQIRQISQLEGNIVKARQRAAMLERDIKLVDALTDVKEKIKGRMAAVELLDSHRSAWVRILEEVSRTVPEFVWLGRFKDEALRDTTKQVAQKETAPSQPVAPPPAVTIDPWMRNARVEGYAFTLNALASFMINMMRSDYFDEVELVKTDEVEFQEEKAYNFVLACHLHYLSDEEVRALIAQADDESVPDSSQTSHKRLN
ncbi:MAG TPA: PilN domain-containing protein [Candidatus Deferrimicrobium sp.]|nr:PilN domain-containing protein [Candidatus Deferrimicrobium sp.]